MEMLELPFMRRALVGAILVGLAAPAIGTYLVQRRLALLGDGIGHVALTGVALGFLLGTAPVVTAVAVAVVGAVIMELLRERGGLSGDVALAMLFYGGIAGGVVLLGLADDTSSSSLLSYLFGSLTTVAPADLWGMAALTAVVLVVTLGLRRALFSICQDEEHARVSGLPVRVLNVMIAVTAALTVTVAMRVVGLLLVSALMVMPVATAQRFSGSFASTLNLAVVLGVGVSVAGVVGSYHADVAPGASIVVLAVALFVLATLATLARRQITSVWGRTAAAVGVRDRSHDDDVVIT